MYFPYLRGRQFELIALREYAALEKDKNNIIPIIEPVKETFNSLKLALPKLMEGDIKFALILNPQVGELIGNTKLILKELKEILGDISKWIPALYVNTDYRSIFQIINDSDFEDIMLLCSDSIDTENKVFQDLIYSPKIKYIVSKENRILKRKLKNKSKLLIRLDDNFKAQKKNYDYLKVNEEKFSEEHIFYSDDGFNGFSDYTVLVSDYIDGGWTPTAVVIHLTYPKRNKEIWIRHFTSISYDKKSTNIQGKFGEAASKAIEFLDENNIHNNATDELRTIFNEQRYPGLGLIKKISIKNHLEIVNKLID